MIPAMIRVLADYECHPTWVRDSAGGVDNVDPASLNLSEALTAALAAWATAFDGTLDHDDPLASGFTGDAEALFAAWGRTLAAWVASETGQAVDYFDMTVNADVTIAAS